MNGLLGLAAALGAAGCTTARAVPPAAQVDDLCQGVAPTEADRPTFLTAAAVSGIRPLMGERHYIKFTEPELRGAEISVRSSPGMTTQWLTRVLRCHAARDASSASPADPFVVGGAPEVVVRETDTGFLIRVAGHDKAEGVEILRRANLLVYGTAPAAHD